GREHLGPENLQHHNGGARDGRGEIKVTAQGPGQGGLGEGGGFLLHDAVCCVLRTIRAPQCCSGGRACSLSRRAAALSSLGTPQGFGALEGRILLLPPSGRSALTVCRSYQMSRSPALRESARYP